MRWFLLLLLFFASCSYDETTTETGHKGKARINPYLAAERFLAECGSVIESRSGWPDLDGELSMVMVPATALSARGYVDDLDEWARYGGHVVVSLNFGEAYLNDWGDFSFRGFGDGGEVPEAFSEWMEEVGVEIDSNPQDGDASTKVEKLSFLGDDYEVFMEAKAQPLDAAGERAMIHSFAYGDGRMTVVADARPFRNRWIGDYDHAALLRAIEESSPYQGSTAFVRNVSLSFFKLLWTRAWPALVALILLVIFWLWKSLPRFGPLDSHQPMTHGRAYDHHLEALGDFHWRLDRAEGLLRPLREALTERAQRLALASGNRDADIFQLIADRSGIPRDRAERAMTFERTKDAGTFTRLVADLQIIHLSIP